MTALLIEESISQVERLIVDTLRYGMQARLPAAATIAALRALTVRGASAGGFSRTEGDLIYVTSAARIYEWQTSLATADNGTTIIKPTDGGATGRWVQVSTSARLGGKYLHEIAAPSAGAVVRRVIAHNGDFSEDALQSRVFGQAPCLAVHFAGEDHKPASHIPGALYRYTTRWEVWSVATCYRDGDEAFSGSRVGSEATVSPGVVKIHGAVKRLLAGVDLGLDTISQVEIGRGTIEEAILAERRFVMSLDVTVRASLHQEDAASDHVALTEIDVTPSLGDLHGQDAIDLDNCVLSGLDVALGGSLTAAIAAGTAMIAGVLATYAGGSLALPGSSDTYRDLKPDGTLVLTSVDAGTDAPAVATGAMRIGVTTTDSLGIVADQFLVATSRVSGPTDVISTL